MGTGRCDRPLAAFYRDVPSSCPMLRVVFPQIRRRFTYCLVIFVARCNMFRGSCFRTKTTTTGLPFHIYPFGFLFDCEADICRTWMYYFLARLDLIWHRAQSLHRSAVVSDSLFFHLGHQNCFPETMYYCQVLKSLRFCIQHTNWFLSIPISKYARPSAKGTLLSWSAQIAGTPEERSVQGHRKTQSSCRLYSRDDVHPALLLQAMVAEWRSASPFHRGSQSPVVEPPVSFALPGAGGAASVPHLVEIAHSFGRMWLWRRFGAIRSGQRRSWLRLQSHASWKPPTRR